MPKKIPSIIFIIIYLFFFSSVLSSWFLVPSSTVFAQAPTGQPTCDLCGWCNPATNPKPPDWDKCRACLYDAGGNEQKGNYYTVFGCISTKPEFFVKSMLSIVFGIAGGTAFLAILYGSAIMLTSSGSPEQLQAGKEIVTSSLIGIFLIIFSVFLLRVVGFEILRIPGFE